MGVIGASVAVATHVDNMFPTQNDQRTCVTTNLGPDALNAFCQTDNDYLTVWRQGSLDPPGPSNIGGVLADQFRPTDLAVAFVTSPSYSGSAETDIIYQAHPDIPGSSDALTWCEAHVDNGRCDQHYVRFRSSVPNVELACHESGHGVGLTHGSRAAPNLSNTDPSLGCMQTPVPPQNDGRLGTHNTQMINASYPN